MFALKYIFCICLRVSVYGSFPQNNVNNPLFADIKVKQMKFLISISAKRLLPYSKISQTNARKLIFSL